MNRALIADDDALSREFLVEGVESLGYQVTSAADGRSAMAEMATEPHLILCDLRMPGADGFAVLEAAKRDCPSAAFILLTAFGTIESAVRALREGADDFLLKPLSMDQLELVVRRVEKGRRLERQIEVLRAEREVEPPDHQIVGRDPALLRALDVATRVARTDATILIRGESGTGKELVASLIHARSRRKDGPFIRVNCAALTDSLLSSELFGHERGAFTGAVAKKPGRFELAAGGTLFLDEIGELSLDVQSKLLRVLETGDYERVGGTRTLASDARIIAATNRDLEAAMREGRYREDLYFRLNVVPVELPPLRDRISDLPALAERFLTRYAREYGSPARRFGAGAMDHLHSQPWTGNVRELANVVQRAVLLAQSPEVTAEDLGRVVPKARTASIAVPVGQSLETMERELILRTLESTGHVRSTAAQLLGITTRTLSNKLRLWRHLGIPCPPPGRAVLADAEESEEGEDR